MKTYILADSRRPPEMWADVRSVESKRTDSGPGVFRTHLNTLFYSAHPNLLMFSDSVLKIQADTHVCPGSLDKPAIVRD